MNSMPLVENAVKHGPARGHRGAITLHVQREGDGIRIAIENPGAFGGRREGGAGLAMVERRMALAYGEDAARLLIESVGERTRVQLVLPANAPHEAGT